MTIPPRTRPMEETRSHSIIRREDNAAFMRTLSFSGRFNTGASAISVDYSPILRLPLGYRFKNVLGGGAARRLTPPRVLKSTRILPGATHTAHLAGKGRRASLRKKQESIGNYRIALSTWKAKVRRKPTG